MTHSLLWGIAAIRAHQSEGALHMELTRQDALLEQLRHPEMTYAAALARVAQRHIDRMRDGWPERAWSEPRLVVHACQDYGLGLIRMLSEYLDMAGLEDRWTVRLATDLQAECRRALKRLEAQARDDAGTQACDRAGRRWRADVGRARA